MEWICYPPRFRLGPPLLNTPILSLSRPGEQPPHPHTILSPTTIPFPLQLKNQDLFTYFIYYAPFRLFLFNAIFYLMLYFVSVCLRGGQQEIQKDPSAPANKKLPHPKFATLTNT